RLGRFYSECEFKLHGLAHLDGPVLEIGRTCVDARYRNGATIAVLWAELAEVLNEGGYGYLMGCASIPMKDGGIQAQAIIPRQRCTCRTISALNCRRCSRRTCAWGRKSAANPAGTRTSRLPTCSSCSSVISSAHATHGTLRQRSDAQIAPGPAPGPILRGAWRRGAAGRSGIPCRVARAA